MKESQRTDRHYYGVAMFGYDPTDMQASKADLQRFAARRSRQTRARLFALIEEPNDPTQA